MKFVLTGKFLEVADIRGGVPHTGIDMRMPENTILRSIKDGFVEKVLHNDKIGNGVVIKGTDGKEYIYGHLNSVDVGPAQHISEGQIIGLSGNTGNSSGPHLHFAVKDHGQFVNPTDMGPRVAEIAGKNNLFSDNWFADKFSKPFDWAGESIQQFLHDTLLDLWHWFILNLPDIIGYTAVGAGIIIILSAMAGKGIIKPIGWFMGAFILAACILGGV